MSDSLRRQEIINEFKTPFRLAERIMELETQRPPPPEPVRDDKGCHFPPERHPIYDHVTHLHYLGDMEGYSLEVCVVCGSVRAYIPVPIA